jgi:hypothetical protein
MLFTPVSDPTQSESECHMKFHANNISHATLLLLVMTRSFSDLRVLTGRRDLRITSRTHVEVGDLCLL